MTWKLLEGTTFETACQWPGATWTREIIGCGREMISLPADFIKKLGHIPSGDTAYSIVASIERGRTWPSK